ncbi:hypothetical protein HY29_17450 [Hyphomonas beringensis]|uniref:Uncharacterized protein n=2 Tax=Hyphomonas beringensis TaxID=1280946 RepID=A0A062UAQ5_9PROT|nr:hypothetical protein HY29_17450 [Hyphomonas beringensis]
MIDLIHINRIVNLANAVLGRPIYTLELSDWDYEPAEYAWHNGELELVLRRPETAELVEILVDLVDAGCILIEDVNAVLEADRSGIRISTSDGGAAVEVIDVAKLPEASLAPGEHVNVRKLVERMDRAMQDRDWSLVLHTSASIFETVAKQVVSEPTIQNKSLGGWFSLYRKRSTLAAPLLDTIEAIFKRRNIEPLAGHGSASDPSITEEEAVQVRELTIAFVRLERTLLTASANRPAQVKKTRGTTKN